jgi:hypothetical protein
LPKKRAAVTIKQKMKQVIRFTTAMTTP